MVPVINTIAKFRVKLVPIDNPSNITVPEVHILLHDISIQYSK